MAKTNSNEKRWYSEREAAEYLGIPANTLRKKRYARQVRYGVRKDGRTIIYEKKDLDLYVEQQYSFYKAAPVDSQ